MASWLVTGANRGIGLALFRLLQARGDSVIAVCRTPSAELQALGVRIEAGIELTNWRRWTTSPRAWASCAAITSPRWPSRSSPTAWWPERRGTVRGFTPTTVFQLDSVTKQFTATLIMD
jgi:NAD(P)-dependent dehydrogenase (short-subunit alcohol dehydrogenase family)